MANWFIIKVNSTYIAPMTKLGLQSGHHYTENANHAQLWSKSAALEEESRLSELWGDGGASITIHPIELD
jgi:hypothetical protein